jgi:hypothetical protein
MSGNEDVGGDVGGEEAAWRDLVARFDSPRQESRLTAPWPEREDLAEPGAEPGTITGELPVTSGEAPDNSVPADRTRVMYLGDPRSYSPPEEQDEPYVPTPLPPPAKLDWLAKTAWTALICGPAYLLLGTLLDWTISGAEALLAIAAFVGGFVVLVLKMGDRPPRDDDDDGAVL